MENRKLSRRLAEVNKKHCVACGTCVKVCPKAAISVWKGCHAAVAELDCIGCGKCAKVCPACCITVKDREVENHES